MNRIKDYKELETKIVTWITDYVNKNNLCGLVIGVSGGIDSAVVSTLCAKTELPTYVLSMPLNSNPNSDDLSDSYTDYLEDNYNNVTKIRVDLSPVYEKFISSMNFWTGDGEFTSNNLANANTKSRMRMVTLYQIAGTIGGIVVGTGNKVEDYGVGFYTKYGDGGVDIAPIADLYKTEVWELGKHLGVDERIVAASPTDGLWDDGRTDEDQLGATYEQIEDAMENGTEGVGMQVLQKFQALNNHKMNPIPTFKL